jgi:hypothetical protein
LAIAQAVADFVQRTFEVSPTQQLPAEFVDLVANDFVEDDVVQPDYYS